jgi:hypothetical protein
MKTLRFDPDIFGPFHPSQAICLRLALAVIGGFIFLVPSLAQEQFGQITGLVTDSSGAPVPSASVEAVNESTGVTKSTTTNVQGNYFIPSLLPGVYKVTVSRPGFKSATPAGNRARRLAIRSRRRDPGGG